MVYSGGVVMRDFYFILGISFGVIKYEIKKVYCWFVFQYYFDVCDGNYCIINFQ